MEKSYTYRVFTYDGGPWNEDELENLTGREFSATLPLPLHQLFGTRVIFWSQGREWIKTAVGLFYGEYILLARRIAHRADEIAWANYNDSRLGEVTSGNPRWN